MSIFNTLRATRNNIQSIIDQYDTRQLNHIPEGFNNNLVWNYGHVIITQQLLCYKMSGLELTIDNNLVDKYREGSKPEGVVSEEEFSVLKSYALATVDQMEADYNKGLFQNYKEYMTSYGVLLDGIETAITFNNVHEGMHLGYMLALKKVIK